MEPTRLYLDTAKLGRMVPGARRAHDAFARLAADEGGSAFFDHFLRRGATDWPTRMVERYPGLAKWRGVSGLKDQFRQLLGAPAGLPVLMAQRSAVLMTLAARLLFGPCRNVLATDLGWPGWHALLSQAAERTGRAVVVAPIRDGILRHGWGEDEVVAVMRDAYSRGNCDGLFLSAVSNLGVRLPVARIAREAQAVRELQFVVVDGSQELSHLPADLGGEHCDLYLAGCHKWMGAGHPLAVGVYGRRRSRGMIDTRLASLTAAGAVDDPLLRLAADLESGQTNSLGETVSLLPLFTAHGAMESAAVGPVADPSVVAILAGEAGWSPLLPSSGLRSSILLLQAEAANFRGHPPDYVREHFGRHGIALTAYPGGVVRVSLPPGGIDEEGVSRIHAALTSPLAI